MNLGRIKGKGGMRERMVRSGVPDPQHYWHFRTDNSLLFRLSCALQDVEQHPWSLPTRCQKNPHLWQSKTSPDKGPLGDKNLSSVQLKANGYSQPKNDARVQTVCLRCGQWSSAPASPGNALNIQILAPPQHHRIRLSRGSMWKLNY